MVEKYVNDPVIGEDVRLFLNTLKSKKRTKVFAVWRYLGAQAWGRELSDEHKTAYDYMLVGLHNRLVYEPTPRRTTHVGT